MWDEIAYPFPNFTWWRHQMETFSALLAICAGNSLGTGEFPEQRPVTRSFDAFFDLRLNKRLSKQSWGWWCETPSRSLLRHCNERLYRWRFVMDNFMSHSVMEGWLLNAGTKVKPCKWEGIRWPWISFSPIYRPYHSPVITFHIHYDLTTWKRKIYWLMWWRAVCRQAGKGFR